MARQSLLTHSLVRTSALPDQDFVCTPCPIHSRQQDHTARQGGPRAQPSLSGEPPFVGLVQPQPHVDTTCPMHTPPPRNRASRRGVVELKLLPSWVRVPERAAVHNQPAPHYSLGGHGPFQSFGFWRGSRRRPARSAFSPFWSFPRFRSPSWCLGVWLSPFDPFFLWPPRSG